jgi:hypothetical protein
MRGLPVVFVYGDEHRHDGCGAFGYGGAAIA